MTPSVRWLDAFISALTTGIITGGSAILAVMVDAGTGSIPSKGAWIVGGITAAISCARTLQSYLRQPPSTETTTTSTTTITTPGPQPPPPPAPEVPGLPTKGTPR